MRGGKPHKNRCSFWTDARSFAAFPSDQLYIRNLLKLLTLFDAGWRNFSSPVPKGSLPTDESSWAGKLGKATQQAAITGALITPEHSSWLLFPFLAASHGLTKGCPVFCTPALFSSLCHLGQNTGPCQWMPPTCCSGPSYFRYDTIRPEPPWLAKIKVKEMKVEQTWLHYKNPGR